MPENNIPIGLQLYSVRQDVEKNLPAVLKEIASWGLTGVEFAGFFNYPAKELKQLLDDNNLIAYSSHVPIHILEQYVHAISDYHAEIGCNNLIISWLPENKRNSEASTIQTANELQSITELLKHNNQSFGFHCHAEDVTPLESGKSPWQILAENTPTDFIMQYDTANGMHGGADPVLPITQLPGRTISLHLKEFKGTPGTPDGQGQAVIGEGDVPWKEVFEAAESVGGTRYYIIEQEGHPTLNPMQAAKKCFENLKAMGK
ncbi:Xylose isomerase-like TIM barrel [Poriferisphaera corsica]|uniref:Xylose isomerase-like TIM barrel n=1 Tax=Poriferisphaera corsica TaxID=2528020 RepID=A0A517YQF5_9BACT|nr:sugar phosphate isomerase/epimerase [Poriferisphaera corsica]QDU32462.1 Xylose isomerase-like TIM barrel [Poriferisphaera corsica]